MLLRLMKEQPPDLRGPVKKENTDPLFKNAVFWTAQQSMKPSAGPPKQEPAGPHKPRAREAADRSCDLLVYLTRRTPRRLQSCLIIEDSTHRGYFCVDA